MKQSATNQMRARHSLRTHVTAGEVGAVAQGARDGERVVYSTDATLAGQYANARY